MVGFGRLLLEQLLELAVAIAGVVALRAAAVVLVEHLVGVVDAAAGVVLAELVIVARDLREPVRSVDGIELAVDPDRLQLVDQYDRRVAEDRDVARRYLDREVLVGAVAEALHDLARLVAVLLDIGTVSRQSLQHVSRKAPLARRQGLHRAADIALPLGQNVDEGFAVERVGQGLAQIRVVEGRVVAVHDQIGAGVARCQLADRLRRLVLHILQHRDRHLERKGHVELTADEGQHSRRAVRNDRVLDPVKIGPPRLPVIRVLRDPDRLVGLELDEFERAGADRIEAHVLRCDVARIDRRVARGDQGQQRRLRPLQHEGGFEIAVGFDRGDVVPPGFAGVGAEPFLAAAAQEIPGAFDVGGGEGLAVMPVDAGVQFESQAVALLAPRPAVGEFGADRLEAVLGDVLVVDDEVVEDPHHRDLGRIGPLLMDRHAGGAVAVVDAQDAARFLGRCGLWKHEQDQKQYQRGAAAGPECHGRPLPIAAVARGRPVSKRISPDKESLALAGCSTRR